MNKLIWFIVAAWIIRSVIVAFKKAFAEAKREIAEQRAREAGGAPPPPSAPVQAEDPRQALLKMLAAAGVVPPVTRVVESTLDYDDDARESAKDYDDDARESGTDYDDDARESATDYDDDADESTTDYDDTPPAPPLVYALPAAAIVYAMPDDATSSVADAKVQAEIMSHATALVAKRGPVHGLDGQSLTSRELVRDSVIMDVLLTRHAGNPFFLRRR